MKIKKIPVPSNSLIAKIQPISYSDSFEAIVGADCGISLEEIQVEFWASRPKWAIRLMKLRNILVKPLGLKTDNILSKEHIESIIESKEVRQGLNLYRKNEHEIVLYKDDKHLRFYFSVLYDGVKISASTIVQLHNTVGKIYFFFIAPFHFLLVKWQFKRILKRLLKTNMK